MCSILALRYKKRSCDDPIQANLYYSLLKYTYTGLRKQGKKVVLHSLQVCNVWYTPYEIGLSFNNIPSLTQQSTLESWLTHERSQAFQECIINIKTSYYMWRRKEGPTERVNFPMIVLTSLFLQSHQLIN